MKLNNSLTELTASDGKKKGLFQIIKIIMFKKNLQREINTFPINPMVLSKLASVDLRFLNDFEDYTPLRLSSEANITEADAQEVLSILFPKGKSSAPTEKTALDLLLEEQETSGIVTFCESLDTMLGDGIPLGKITEICGAPGLGKTQLCLQLAVDIQIPVDIGGLDGEAVYLDTEGSFIVERLVDIATATVDHCQLIHMQGGGELGSIDISVEQILAGIHYFHCLDHTEFLACVHQLPTFLSQHQKVKLIIVDSIASPFRHEFSDMSLRTKLLSMLGQTFIKIASQNSVAVVFTNQMTTKIPAVPGNQSSQLIPALGEGWAHISNMKIMLYWENNQRRAMLCKSPNQKELICSFQITNGGIRDVTATTNTDCPLSNIAHVDSKNSTASTSTATENLLKSGPTPPAKRQKVS
nr:DNA repair protein RAD51-like protein 3-like [Biomphalaria glabrata]